MEDICSGWTWSHRLLQSAGKLTDWVTRGAAIYVCSSVKGMASGIGHRASGVDAALRQILGDSRVNELAREGRYQGEIY